MYYLFRCNLMQFFKIHSQKVAFALFASSGVVTYALQPYYEVLMRWSTSVFDYGKERQPGPRVYKALNEVMDDLNIPADCRHKVSIYCTSNSESTSLGKIKSQYCFLGVPYLADYYDTKSVPLDIIPSERGLYLFNPESTFGKNFMKALIIPEQALKFLIARELIKLSESDVLHNKSKTVRKPTNPRTASYMSSIAVTAGIYVAYQAAYFSNRIKNGTPRLSIKFIRYAIALLGGLALQSQIMQAWRRHRCLSADWCAVSINSLYYDGGLEYYKWRIQLNKMLNDLAKIQKYNADKIIEEKYDPVAELQEQTDDYYIPKIYQQEIEEMKIKKYNDLPNRYTKKGNEKYTADGESIGFGLSAFLSAGGVGYGRIADLFGVICAPANSHMRLGTLQQYKSRLVNN